MSEPDHTRDDAGPAAGGGSRTPLLFLGVGLVGLFAAGAFLPRSPDMDYSFGFESYRHLGGTVFLAAAVALLALLALPGAAERIGRSAARAFRRVPGRAAPLLAAVLFATAAWLLPNRTVSGDAGSVLYFAAVGRIYPSNPLACYLFEVVRTVTGLDPALAIRLTSVLSGAAYAASAVAIAREVAGDRARAAGIATLLLGTGTVALFFGTLEVYAPFVALLAVYLLVGIRWLHGKGRGFAPPLVLGLALGFHGMALTLLPSLVLLANRGRFRPIAFGRIARCGLLFLVALLPAVLAVYFGAWGGEIPAGGTSLYGTALGAEGEGPILPLWRTAYAPRQMYAIFDLHHIVGLLNLLLLLCPVGLVLLALGDRRKKDPVFRFASVAAIFLFLLVNVWNTSYPIRSDWDLLSPLGVPLSLLAALAWYRSPRSAGAVVRVAALVLFALVPVLVANSVRPRPTAAYARLIADQLRRAVPVTAPEDAVRVARADASEAGLVAPPGKEREFWSGVEDLTREVVDRSGILLTDWTVFDMELLAKDIERTAAERPGGPRLDPESLAFRCTTELSRVLDDLRENPGPPPPTGVLASWVADRIVPGGEEQELLAVLDVLDVAMAAGDGASVHRPDPTDFPFEEWLAPLVSELSHRIAEAVPTRRWTELLAGAVRRALDEERARAADLRWADLLDAARRWEDLEAACSPPGNRVALERANWFAGCERLPVVDRYAVVERDARHALKRSPDDPTWSYLLAEAVHRQGAGRRAVPLYRKAIRLAPDELGRRLDLGILLRAMGEKEEALRVVAHGVRFDPWHARCPWALLFLAELRDERRQPAIAEATAREGLRIVDRAKPLGSIEGLAARLRPIAERGN